MRHLVYNIIYTYSVVPINSSLHYNPRLIRHLVYKVRYSVVLINFSLHYNPRFIQHLVYNVNHSVVPINSSLLTIYSSVIRTPVYNDPKIKEFNCKIMCFLKGRCLSSSVSDWLRAGRS
jgi:hypothetical protein